MQTLLLIAGIIAAWVICGAFAWAGERAYRLNELQAALPHSRPYSLWDASLAAVLWVFGPFGLCLVAMTAGFSHGLRWGRIHTADQVTDEQILRDAAQRLTDTVRAMSVHLSGTMPSLQLSVTGSSQLPSAIAAPPAAPQPLLTINELDEKDELRIGWREFNFAWDAHRGVVLIGRFQHEWAGATLQATCQGDADLAEEHILNYRAGFGYHVGGAACGIYSTKRPAHNGWPYTDSLVIQARCVSWEAVANGPDGYRAQHCRIEELYVVSPNEPLPLMHGLRERYDVPVTWFTPHEWSGLLAEWEVGHGPDRTP